MRHGRFKIPTKVEAAQSPLWTRLWKVIHRRDGGRLAAISMVAKSPLQARSMASRQGLDVIDIEGPVRRCSDCGLPWCRCIDGIAPPDLPPTFGDDE